MLSAISMACFAFSAGMLIWNFRPRFAVLAPPIRPAVAMVIDLVRANRDWEKDGHVWFHPSGVNIWVANGDYGLGIVFGAKDRHEWATSSDSKGRGFTLTQAEKKAVWKAIQAPANADANVLAVASKIAEMYQDARPRPPLDNVVSFRRGEV